MHASINNNHLAKYCKNAVNTTFVMLSCLAMSAIAQTNLPPLNERDTAMTMPGEFNFASVGDLMIRRPASQLADPEVQAVFELLREADLTVGNMEGELSLIHI